MPLPTLNLRKPLTYLNTKTKNAHWELCKSCLTAQLSHVTANVAVRFTDAMDFRVICTLGHREGRCWEHSGSLFKPTFLFTRKGLARLANMCLNRLSTPLQSHSSSELHSSISHKNHCRVSALIGILFLVFFWGGEGPSSESQCQVLCTCLLAICVFSLVKWLHFSSLFFCYWVGTLQLNEFLCILYHLSDTWFENIFSYFVPCISSFLQWNHLKHGDLSFAHSAVYHVFYQLCFPQSISASYDGIKSFSYEVYILVLTFTSIMRYLCIWEKWMHLLACGHVTVAAFC